MLPLVVCISWVHKWSRTLIGLLFKPKDVEKAGASWQRRTKILTLILWASLLISFFTYQYTQQVSSFDIAVQILHFLMNSPWGPWLYVLAYILRPLFLFPATLLTLISGALFGFWGGIAYTLIGENASASFAYAFGRFLGKDTIPLKGQSLLSKWKTKFHEHAFLSLLIMRLSFLPFDLINYVSGLAHIPYGTYVIATAIGIFPGLSAFVSFGSSVENFETLDLSQMKLSTSSLLLGGAFLLLGLCLMLFFRHRELKKRHGL